MRQNIQDMPCGDMLSLCSPENKYTLCTWDICIYSCIIVPSHAGMYIILSFPHFPSRTRTESFVQSLQSIDDTSDLRTPVYNINSTIILFLCAIFHSGFTLFFVYVVSHIVSTLSSIVCISVVAHTVARRVWHRGTSSILAVFSAIIPLRTR
jgi:hypothetical protein